MVMSRLLEGISSSVEDLPTGIVREIVRVLFPQLPTDGNERISV